MTRRAEWALTVLLVGLTALASKGEIATPSPAAARLSQNASLAGRVDGLFAAEPIRASAPGFAIAVVTNGGMVVSKGYGLANVETRIPATADTLFQIGSVTKTLTAMAVLSATGSDSGVSLASAVGTLITGLTPCLQQLTLAQLLSHTGGLIDEPAEFGPQGEEGLAAYPRTWGADYCLLPPGRVFSYSNAGYALAGLALQEREQKPFADVVRTRVLEPLGMLRSTFRPTEAMTYPLAVGHRTREGRAQVVRPLPNDARLWPAGTLYSSAEEMARLVQALLDEGRVGGRQALPSAVVRQMLAPRASRPTVGGEYGFGLELDDYHGVKRFGHGGAMTGYTAQIAIVPDRKLGVVVLANGDAAPVWRIVDGVLDIVLDGNLPTAASPVTQTTSTPTSTPVGELNDYVGTYANPRRFTVEVTRQGDQLVLRRFGRDFPMRLVTADRFVVDRPGGGEEAIAFGLRPDGLAEYLVMNVWALARLGVR
jgi:CubicO group peptidase (beta-lactamase class C family)